jgi:hypothetical protein
LIKEILVQTGSVEGIAAPAMRQRQPGGSADIRLADLASTTPGGMSGCSPRGHDVCSHTVNLERATYPGNGRQLLIAQPYRRQ